MESTDLKEFLKFRKKFTKREWNELNQVISLRLNEKADKLELDDLDIKIIEGRLSRHN